MCSECTEPVKTQSPFVPQSASTTSSTGYETPQASILQQTTQPKVVPELQRSVPVQQQDTKEFISDHLNKQSHKLSSVDQGTRRNAEGLNVNSTSIKPEPGKQFVERKQAGNVSVSGASKDSQRRGSNSSSVSSLSDIIQDIRISPHEAKLATENVPTKGK